MKQLLWFLPLLSMGLVSGPLAAAETSQEGPGSRDEGAAHAIVQSLRDEHLARLTAEILKRNPRLAVLQAEANAAEQRAPQVRGLPDPSASLTLFLLQPETRVGPQQAALGLNQRLPWFGKLRSKEQAALLEAAAAQRRVEALRLELVTRARKLSLELGYLDREQEIVSEDRITLEHYEELAQARYASGVGLGQSVIKIQAEITRARTRLLDIEERRAGLVAEINALRDRPESTPVLAASSPARPTAVPEIDRLREAALSGRPELLEAELLIEAAEVRVELAQKQGRPDFSVGLNYALVGERDDRAGRLNPPEDNGRDILGLSGGLSLPIWRAKIAAGVEEAIERRLAAEEKRRVISAEIDADLAALARRIPLMAEQLTLFDRVLTLQAEESLRSAESAYASGTVGALDLLDAERVLLGVRIAAERARTDLAVAMAELEGVAAAPFESFEGNGSVS